MTQVLLVEPDRDRRAKLAAQLRGSGFAVVEREVVGRDIQDLEASEFDCVVAAADQLAELGNQWLRAVPVVLVDHRGDARQAVAAMKRGASDYIVAPFEPDELIAAVERANSTGREASGGPLNMVGSSKPMQVLFDLIAKVGPTDSMVLIEGESGTGKELVARALHAASSRRKAPLITLNCATIPPQMIQAELFGYPRSEIEGAQPFVRRGLLEAADGGTLFLDEVGELPAEAQARLLRVLEDGELREFGSTAARPINVRLITATHRDLRQLIASGQFRNDLYYRLNVVNLRIPPLRQRGEDVLELADAILQRTAERLSKSCQGFSQAARTAMMNYAWPGNVRELANAIERAVILSSGGEIEADLLAIELAPALVAESSAPIADQTSLEDYFVSFVCAHQDQLTETELAEKLGISRKSLWERRQRLNIPRKKTRKRGPRRDNS